MQIVDMNTALETRKVAGRTLDVLGDPRIVQFTWGVRCTSDGLASISCVDKAILSFASLSPVLPKRNVREGLGSKPSRERAVISY